MRYLSTKSTGYELSIILLPLLFGSLFFFSGAIFIHTFGAYFGIALSLLMRKKDFGRFSENLEGSNYNSDIFSVVGTVLLWIFWPSFNAILANSDAYHRAILNTYISLLGSTVMTFVISRAHFLFVQISTLFIRCGRASKLSLNFFGVKC